MSRDWNWDGEDASVVIPRVQATAVYINTRGEIVIRQQAAYGEEDSLIILPRSAVSDLIGALMAASDRDPTEG